MVINTDPRVVVPRATCTVATNSINNSYYNEQIVCFFVSVDKPGKPEELIIKGATSSAVTLAWQAPADDGGAPVTNYVVEYRKEGV